MGKKSRIKKLKKTEKQTSVNIEPSEKRRTFHLIHNTYIHIVLIVIIGFISYANAFHAPFQWDEGYFIVDNPIVKDIGFFAEPSKALNLGNRYVHLKSRYVGYLTFALNYKMHGTHVTGYHIVNFAIHIGAAVLVYVLVLLTFRTPFLEQSILKKHSYYIALFTGLLFVSHPIQTEAVTYIFQRLASLGAFFYLLSLTTYISSRLATGTIKKCVFYAVSLISVVLAMKTKENAFTLPFVIALFEFAFFTGSVRSRISRLIPFSLTLLIIPLTIIGINKPLGDIITDIGPAAADTQALSRGEYFFTQMRVILTYIRLLFFPAGQHLDYWYPVFTSFFSPQVFFSAGVLMGLIGLAVYLFNRSRFAIPDLRIIAFGIFWFFITLSVESSIIPLNTILNEYRLYLPSAGFFILLVTGVFLFSVTLNNRNIFKVIIAVLIFVTLVLSYLTYSRNAVWASKIGMWEDIAQKSPNNVRAHNNLGNAYMAKGILDKAIEHYEIALRLNPDVLETHNNLCNALTSKGLIDKAIEHCLIALEHNPRIVETHNNLANAYRAKGLIDKAIEHYKVAVEINPDFAGTYSNLGNAYMSKGLVDKAIEHYKIALKLMPDYTKVHIDLANAYMSKGLVDKAIEHYKIAIRLKPDYADSHFNLGLIFLRKGLLDDALNEFKIVLTLKPDDALAKYYIDHIGRQRTIYDGIKRR